MPVKRITIPERYDGSGYSSWGIKRTIRESVNIARWSPWHAHAWMEEAKVRLSLDNPYFAEYDEAVHLINAHWVGLRKYHWFDEEAFWSVNGEYREPRLLEPIHS